jgi:polyisoprenoid-binding protein YceI
MYDEEWLDAEKFPTITFQVLKLEGVQVTSDNGITIKAQAVGKFTLHGVSKEMKIPITMKYVKESEATKKRAAGDLVMINANFSVALKDYNVKYHLVLNPDVYFDSVILLKIIDFMDSNKNAG